MGAAYIKAVIAAVATNPAKNSFFTALLLEIDLNLHPWDTSAAQNDSPG
jgi:hypothetical protein